MFDFSDPLMGRAGNRKVFSFLYLRCLGSWHLLDYRQEFHEI